jgi:excisionase family DNA binding protein
MTLDDLPLLLTVEEAARLMRVSRNGAYNAVAEGMVHSIRIGRTIRIPRDALALTLGINANYAEVTDEMLGSAARSDGDRA